MAVRVESHNPTIPVLTGFPTPSERPKSVPWWQNPSMLGIAIAIVLGLIGIALAVSALLVTPSKTVGIQGPAGAVGATGAQGPQGLSGPVGSIGATGLTGKPGAVGATGLTGKPGAVGATGAAGKTGAPGPAGVLGQTGATGPAGTIASSAAIAGPTLLSVPNPPIGTTLTATTSCPAGQVLLSGGAQVSAPGSSNNDVALRSSFPLNSHSWESVGLVTGKLGVDQTMKLKPFVLCGVS